MGLLERWDERNQAWADRKRAEPYPPPRSRFWTALNTVCLIFVIVRFVLSVASGEWLTAILFGPLAIAAVYILSNELWALRRHSRRCNHLGADHGRYDGAEWLVVSVRVR